MEGFLGYKLQIDVPKIFAGSLNKTNRESKNESIGVFQKIQDSLKEICVKIDDFRSAMLYLFFSWGT